jgi:tRNA A37 threonylcarbamoyladenosine dehydratase/ubiquitin-protein ligase
MNVAMLSSRLLFEIGLLTELQKHNPSFKKFSIKKKSPLLIGITLKIKDNEYLFDLVFPNYYPYQPLIIKAKTNFKTSHQYTDGTMCLKWGVDNWSETINSQIMIENLIELLDLENPLGSTHGIAPSGDQFTNYQESRRHPVTLFIQLADINHHFPKKQGTGTIAGRTFNNSLVLFLGWFKFLSSKEAKKERIKLGSIPPILKQYSFVYKKFDMTSDEYFKKYTDKLNAKYQVHFHIFKHSLMATYLKKLSKEEIKKHTAQIKKDKKHPYHEYSSSKLRKTIKFLTHSIKIIFEKDERTLRTIIGKDDLKKKITIFGLGSVGSRVFIDLTKAGYENFVLCDGDLFLPSNFSRHTLGFTSLGDSKIDGLLKYVEREINPQINIKRHQFALNGQEDSKSLDELFVSIKDSDIIIDCSADSNLIISLNELVSKMDKPYISGTIVSGGLGHVLVKRNKGSHLSILDLLETQKKYMKVNNINQSQQNNYEAMIQDKPFVASQSDVSIIAGLIGKHAIDLLMNRNILKDDIYFFSTSNEFLGEAFTVQPLSANPRVNNEKPLDSTLIEKGKTVWKSLSLKK